MWEDLELDPERIPAFKLAFHVAQILFAFVLWALEIAVFRADGAKVVGNNGWTFAAFFLTIPAWIYLIMAPRFPRTRKIAQPHAMLAVDCIYTIIWLSAFATQAAYNTANLCGSACNLSKAIVGLGFFVFLFFAITSFLSIWTLKYYQWHNRLPGYDRAQLSKQNIDPDKAAFSLAPHEEDAYAPVHMHDQDHDPDHDRDSHSHGHNLGQRHNSNNNDDDDDPYASGAGARSDYSDPYGSSSMIAGAGGSMVSGYQDNPFRQHEANSPFDATDTEYHSGRLSAMGGRYGATTPSAMSGLGPDPYDDDTARPARFPAANYDRIAG